MLLGASLGLINLQVGVSADRFWAVVSPFSYFQNQHSGYKKWIILICLTLGLFVGSLHAIGLNNCKENEIPSAECGLFHLNQAFLMIFIIWTINSTILILIANTVVFVTVLNRVS